MRIATTIMTAEEAPTPKVTNKNNKKKVGDEQTKLKKRSVQERQGEGKKHGAPREKVESERGGEEEDAKKFSHFLPFLRGTCNWHGGPGMIFFFCCYFILLVL